MRNAWSAPAAALKRATALRPTRRDARLVSGVILFVYVATHLANHALGSISMAAAEGGLRLAVAVWQSVPGTLLLYGAAATHIGLAFLAVCERRTLRMPPLELLRIFLGFSMPTLLIGHAVGTRVALAAGGHVPDYAHVVWMLQHSGRQGLQVALLVPGWLHGCLGLRFAFGRSPWYGRARHALFGAALLLPVLAVLGFVAMSKEVSALAADPRWAADLVERVGAGEQDAQAALRDRLLLAYGIAVAAAFTARYLRVAFEERRATTIAIAYPARVVRVPRGWSVLDASRAHGIAHRSSCGGQGRCSTCRVRITAGAPHCPPPQSAERATLARIGEGSGIRLACQLRPAGDIGVVPLIHEEATRDLVQWQALERDLAVVHIAVRWNTAFVRLLPHDRLYVVRRLHETVRDATRRVDATIGPTSADHVALWFEVAGEADPRALRCASQLADALDEWADQLARTIGCRANVVVAVHRGLVAVGEADAAAGASKVAVGDPLDVARSAARHHDVRASDGTSGAVVLASANMLDAIDRDAALRSRSRARVVRLPGGETVAFFRLPRSGREAHPRRARSLTRPSAMRAG